MRDNLINVQNKSYNREEKQNMPIFGGVNCLEKFCLYTLGLLVVYWGVESLIMVYVGLYASIITFVFLNINLMFLVDKFGDRILTQSKYFWNEKQIIEIGNENVQYNLK